MKKNDHDFIKEKIEQSGVSAPAGMDERFVLEKLSGVQPEETAAQPKIIEMQPKKPRYKLISGIAAAVVAVFTLSVLGVMYFGKKADSPIDRPTVGISAPGVSEDVPLKTFGSYDELKDQMKEVSGKYSSYYGSSLRKDGSMMAVEEDAMASNDSYSGGSSDSSKAGSSGSESHSETYLQVAGVDEADVVKTDGRYIYVVEEGDCECVRIYSATETPELVATVFPGSFENATATPDEYIDDSDDVDVFVQEIFLSGDKLIVVGMLRGEHFTYSSMAMVYDVSDIGDITLVDQFHQSGYYSTSRMIGDTLYILSEESVYVDEFEPPVCYRGTNEQDIPIDCVYSVKDPTDNDMLILGGYSVADGSEEVRTAAVVGSVEDVYCSENNMYIYSTRWHYDVLVDYETDEDVLSDSYMPRNTDPIKTSIYKVSLTDGIAFTAYGEVDGWLDSRYSLDEKDGFLRVATTTENELYIESNNLFILDSSLNQVGSVTGFAKDESIKAVRYVGDTAYVITYEQTDPLFVIDVSDPAAPAILGEVKIDGFSSMLVPVDENTVLGLGYYTEDADYTTMQVQRGFKLALFDVSDKLNPKVLDEKIYRDYYSPVMEEPRALVYNPDRGDYLIPLDFYDAHLDSDIDYYMPDIRGGALNFAVENGRIVERGLYQVNTDNSDADIIERCLYVGDTIFMISREYYAETKIYTAKYEG